MSRKMTEDRKNLKKMMICNTLHKKEYRMIT